MTVLFFVSSFECRELASLCPLAVMYGAFHLFCTIDFSSAFYTQHFLFNHYLWFVSKIISFSLCRMAHNCVDSVHCAPQLDEQYHYCSKSFFFSFLFLTSLLLLPVPFFSSCLMPPFHGL